MVSESPASRHFSMLRNYHLADLVTLANAACGVGSIFLVQSHLLAPAPWKLPLAMALLPLALLMDFLDGFVARKRHTQGPMGRELDSLSDVISFGVAPAVLGFALGLQGVVDVALLLFFVACGISRLARFNVTAEQLTGANGKVKYFEGTPITFSLLTVALGAYCLLTGQSGESLPLGQLAWGGVVFHPVSLVYAVSGSLMISKTLHVPKP